MHRFAYLPAFFDKHRNTTFVHYSGYAQKSQAQWPYIEKIGEKTENEFLGVSQIFRKMPDFFAKIMYFNRD